MKNPITVNSASISWNLIRITFLCWLLILRIYRLLPSFRRLKQKSVHVLWNKHDEFLTNCFWKGHTFWSESYFVCSIGEANPDTIRKYIESQGWWHSSHWLKINGFSAKNCIKMVISLRSGSIDTSAALLAEMDHETCHHLFNWVLPASGVIMICFFSF